MVMMVVITPMNTLMVKICETDMEAVEAKVIAYLQEK